MASFVSRMALAVCLVLGASGAAWPQTGGTSGTGARPARPGPHRRAQPGAPDQRAGSECSDRRQPGFAQSVRGVTDAQQRGTAAAGAAHAAAELRDAELRCPKHRRTAALAHVPQKR